MNKIYVGSAKTIETKFGEIMKVSFSEADIEKMKENLNNGRVKVAIMKRKESDNYGNTHYCVIDNYKSDN